MKTMKMGWKGSRHKVVLAMLCGIAIGILGATAIHAQRAQAPRAYLVVEEDVTDPAAFQTYTSKVPQTLAPFGAEYLIRGGKLEAAEGEAPKRFVVIAFDNFEKAQAWWNSPAYAALKPIRHKAARSRIFIAEGLPR